MFKKFQGNKGDIKEFFEDRRKRELIAVLVILVIAIVLSIPPLIGDLSSRNKEDGMENNEWQVSDPGKQGMDAALLNKAQQFAGETEALSLLVIRNGTIVLEKYYNDASAQQYNNVFSVTKSFISALVGIAIQQGKIKGVDQKISDFFPEYFTGDIDPRKKEITVGHLLTMTPGFIEDFDAWIGSENMVEYTFKLPLKFDPGKEFQYANSASHLLSCILTRATGMSTDAYAQKYLFDPLGIKDRRWNADRQGNNIGASELYLRPRDMAKLGYLYLKKGVWEGKEIIDPDWIAASTAVQFSFSNTGDKVQSGYGYKWWITDEYGEYTFSAKGHGGQNVCVIPSLDLIVVTTSLPDRPMSFNDEHLQRLLKEYVLPAVMKQD